MAPIELKVTPGQPAEDKLLFNRDSLLYRLENDQELMDEILELFLEDAEEHLAQLRAAVAAQDAGTVTLKAHSLKGASANVSAELMSGLAYQLERRGKAGELDGSESLIEELQESLAALRKVLAGQG